MQEPLWWFPWEGTGRAGSTGLGLASENNFHRFQGTGAVPICLRSGPGAIRADGEWPEVGS